MTLTQQLSKMKAQATASYFGSWGQTWCSASWPEMLDYGPAPAAAPVEADDDSEEPEEPEPLSDDEAPDQPEDDSDTPPEDEAEASPYDSEVEEEKMPVAVRPARGPTRRGEQARPHRGQGGTIGLSGFERFSLRV